jgi:hypothetical protein
MNFYCAEKKGEGEGEVICVNKYKLQLMDVGGGRSPLVVVEHAINNGNGGGGHLVGIVLPA